MKLASPSGKSLLEERLEEKQNGALTAPPLNINGVVKVSLYVMLVYLRLPYLSWTFRRPCFGQMVPPSSPSCSRRAADTALLQPNETLFNVLTLTEPYSEANFMFVALSFLISFSEPWSNRQPPASHDAWQTLSADFKYAPNGGSFVNRTCWLLHAFQNCVNSSFEQSFAKLSGCVKESQLLPGRPRFRCSTATIKR